MKFASLFDPWPRCSGRTADTAGGIHQHPHLGAMPVGLALKAQALIMQAEQHGRRARPKFKLSDYRYCPPASIDSYGIGRPDGLGR